MRTIGECPDCLRAMLSNLYDGLLNLVLDFKVERIEQHAPIFEKCEESSYRVTICCRRIPTHANNRS